MKFCKHAVSDMCDKDGRPCIYSKDCCEPEEPEPMTNAQKIRAMSDEELAAFLELLTYGKAPWSDAFVETFCNCCPATKCEIPDYWNPVFLHECDYSDGGCPHGSEVFWWLGQEAEEETKWM